MTVTVVSNENNWCGTAEQSPQCAADDAPPDSN